MYVLTREYTLMVLITLVCACHRFDALLGMQHIVCTMNVNCKNWVVMAIYFLYFHFVRVFIHVAMKVSMSA